MKQQKFSISALNGGGEVTAGSFKAAIEKSGFKPDEIIAVCATANYKSAGQLAKIIIGPIVGQCFVLTDLSGFTVTSKTLDAFNIALETLGYKPVRVTCNMLNKASGEFLIDADTPSYCDPGCESYHSM